MAWEHLDVNRPHLVYIVLGGFTTLFMLCSSIIKERLYIGEATVATICGIIFGPHAANLIDPGTWGNTDQITLEFSRIVLVVQCFAVGVELPKAYMERHWRSVTFLLIPVMTFGWLITSLFIWAVFHPTLNWLDSLCIAACVTATDPVLASSVVGKGKFAKRVPKHLRDLLSAESGCNDGMAFPFIYLALYLIQYRPNAGEVAYHWICFTILYECVFGAVYGVCIGYIARRAIKYAHEHNYVDRESFLVFYFVLALFCAGSGSILGVDDLLVGFACGVGFSNDGWFTEETEESHVSNVIDLLINLAFFVYFGTIIPWSQYNAHFLQLDVWRLVVIALLVLFFRRIPIMLALKPIIPDIKTWREALFAGHFGPIGVGAIFVAILARGELESKFEGTTPLAELPEPGFPHYNIIELIWPITTFLVICSIVVHGSSVAVFTLGKHINTLTLTMSYTQANEQGPSWMDRLPRIQSRSRSSMSIQRSDDGWSDNEKGGEYDNGALPPGMRPGNFLRRQREEDNPSRGQSRASSRHRSRRSRQFDDRGRIGGPISQSAIAPNRKHEATEANESKDSNKQGQDTDGFARSDSDTLAQKSDSSPSGGSGEDKGQNSPIDPDDVGEIYEEGHHTVYEDHDGNVLAVEKDSDEHVDEGQDAREKFEEEESKRLVAKEHAEAKEGGGSKDDDKHSHSDRHAAEEDKGAGESSGAAPERPGKRWREGLARMSTLTGLTKAEMAKPKNESKRARGPARAYQYGNTIIVEDEDGEVIKKYDIPAPERKPPKSGEVSNHSSRMGQIGSMLRHSMRERGGASGQAGTADKSEVDQGQSNAATDADDDPGLRFTIDAGGRRMSKAEFIDQIRNMNPRQRAKAVEDSSAPEEVKEVARQDARETSGQMQRRTTNKDIPTVDEAPQEGVHTDTSARLKSSGGEGQSDMKLVDSNEEEVPFHNVTADLWKHRNRSSGRETAAERRRREALQSRGDSDSEDDGTERVPPKAKATSSSSRAHPSEVGDSTETAAERRRREGALGLRREADSDSDEENEAAQSRGIQFADEPRMEGNGHRARPSALRWGKNIGR